MIEDMGNVILWTSQHIEQYGGDKRRVFLIGHSAGAHILAQFFVKKALYLKFGSKSLSSHKFTQKFSGGSLGTYKDIEHNFDKHEATVAGK